MWYYMLETEHNDSCIVWPSIRLHLSDLVSQHEYFSGHPWYRHFTRWSCHPIPLPSTSSEVEIEHVGKLALVVQLYSTQYLQKETQEIPVKCCHKLLGLGKKRRREHLIRTCTEGWSKLLKWLQWFSSDGCACH